MTLVVVASNWLVQYPINTWLTWSAFVYPVAFLVTELTNRSVGTEAARRVAWLAAGDLGIKWLMAVLLLGPYRAMLPHLQAWVPQGRAS